MESTVFNWADGTTSTTPTRSMRQWIDAPTAMLAQLRCHATTVNAGQAAHAPHEHPDEELIIVKEGEISMLVNGENKLVSAGAIVFLAAGQMHGIRNTSQAPATYYVVRWRAKAGI